MVNIVLGSSYYIWRWNMWPTGSTFGTKFSVRKEAKDLENVNTFLLHFLSFYLKKSSLQNTSLSLTKHLSLRVSLQWAHFRHLECQLLSNTFRMKRSRIKSPQPVHFGILAEMKKCSVKNFDCFQYIRIKLYCEYHWVTKRTTLWGKEKAVAKEKKLFQLLIIWWSSQNAFKKHAI